MPTPGPSPLGPSPPGPSPPGPSPLGPPDPAPAARRRRLLGSLLAALLPLPGAYLLAATAPACPAAPFRATIMQLLRRDAARPAAAWPALMRDLQHFGLHDLVLQWTSIGDTDFYGGHPSAADVLPVLPTLLAAAHGAGLRVWIGLHQDPHWWSAATRPTAELDAWFARKLADLDARLPALAATLATAPPGTVAGWYVSDELDDATWQAPPREAALTRYLRALAARLRRLAPGRPIAISAFANGAQAPAAYAAQLRRLATAAGLGRLLLQDGIGAGKRTPAQARATAQAAAQALRGSAVRLGMVVELFDLAPATPTTEAAGAAASVPAPLATMLARLAATAGLGDLPPTSFSHVHHLTAFGGPLAATRGTQWSQHLKHCPP